MPTPPVYDLQPVRLPRLAGKPFGLFVRLLESRVLGPPLARKMLADLGIPRFRGLEVDEPPTFQPLWPAAGGETVTAAPAALPAAAGEGIAGFRMPAVADYTAAYGAGRATPEEVAERALAAIAQSDHADPPLRAFLSLAPAQTMADARASTARWRARQPLGPLDGVPLAVKDELDLAGQPTRVGTRFLGASPASEDAAAVARWRAAGGVVLGKTNMHEIGIGVTGFNRHHGTPRNPFAPRRYTGGSSSGSAAAVAAGLCPLLRRAAGRRIGPHDSARPHALRLPREPDGTPGDHVSSRLRGGPAGRDAGHREALGRAGPAAPRARGRAPRTAAKARGLLQPAGRPTAPPGGRQAVVVLSGWREQGLQVVDLASGFQATRRSASSVRSSCRGAPRRNSSISPRQPARSSASGRSCTRRRTAAARPMPSSPSSVAASVQPSV
jgi:Amidase